MLYLQICCADRHRYKQHWKTSNRNMHARSQPIHSLLPQPGECGNVISNRIYGGNKTKIDEYPWMALLEYHKGIRTENL